MALRFLLRVLTLQKSVNAICALWTLVARILTQYSHEDIYLASRPYNIWDHASFPSYCSLMFTHAGTGCCPVLNLSQTQSLIIILLCSHLQRIYTWDHKDAKWRSDSVPFQIIVAIHQIKTPLIAYIQVSSLSS